MQSVPASVAVGRSSSSRCTREFWCGSLVSSVAMMLVFLGLHHSETIKNMDFLYDSTQSHAAHHEQLVAPTEVRDLGPDQVRNIGSGFPQQLVVPTEVRGLVAGQVREIGAGLPFGELQMAGWEDEWMQKWKREHHRQYNYRCQYDSDGNAGVCELPRFLPPRARSKHAQLIPRVIFQTWKSTSVDIPTFASATSWISKNPEYEYFLFDDSDMHRFVCENSNVTVKLSFSTLLSGAARADVFRLLLLQKYGGIYLDIDTYCLTPLPIPVDANVVSGVGCWSELRGRIGGILEHWAMAYTKNHPITERTLSTLLENLSKLSDFGKFNTITTTGPGAYQIAFQDLLKEGSCHPELLCNATKAAPFRVACPPNSSTTRALGKMVFLDSLNYNMTFWNKAFRGSELERETLGSNDSTSFHYSNFGRRRPILPGKFCKTDWSLSGELPTQKEQHFW